MTQRNSRVVASRLRRPRSFSLPGGIGSRSNIRANARHARKSSSASTTLRPQKNGVLTPTRKASAPRPASTPQRIVMAEGSRGPLFGRERAQEVHHVPRLPGGERLAVRRHDGAADDDVAVPVAIRALALQLGVAQIRRWDELRRDGTGDATLALGAVAGRAEGLEVLAAGRYRVRRRPNRVRLSGRDITLLLRHDELTTSRHDAGGHLEYSLAGHDARRLRHVVDPPVAHDQAHETSGARDDEQDEDEDVLHWSQLRAPGSSRAWPARGARGFTPSPPRRQRRGGA